jgi:hypothetical protein
VHIGTNSFTIEDASTSSSGKDEIASSINELQIGTSTSHNTTVLGTLSVQTPTSDNHATTKAYVDTATNANTSNITTNTSNISSNASNISSNTSSASTNTSSIASNAANITTNTNSININTGNISTNTNSIGNLNTMIRQDNNTIHIGQNSVVFEDNGNQDTMYSSSDQLNIGRIGHNTSVIGTLSVPDPIAPMHATSKRYVDSGLAQAFAAAALPQAMNGESNISIALGQHNNEKAIALGLSHHDNENKIIYRFIGSRSNNSLSSAASVGWSF